MRQNCRRGSFRTWLLLSFLLWLSAGLLPAQTSTGGINGTISDQSGANIAGAVIALTSGSTGSTRLLTASSSGTYAITSLEPGEYDLRVSATGFQTLTTQVRVLVGQIANGNFTLAPGQQVTQVEVGGAASDLQVNTTQPTIQDALTAKDIDNIPLNGRNFLDLAQLTPGVQIQDGGNFDPTKNGFTGISMQGRSGRSTRIEVDGVDITDETVGTTTINISEDSIQEFQVAQSMLDPATSLTSSGSVNVVTRSGSNAVHGSGFYLFRNDATAARVAPEKAPFERDQVGFRLGGPFLKDRLFWFTNYEHTLQHGTVFTEPTTPFSNYSGAFSSPFHELEATARLDWNITQNWRTFYAIHHDQFNVVTGFGGSVLSPYSNRNLTDVHTVALDGATGQFSHSFRYGYLTFRNFINDARSQVNGLPSRFPMAETPPSRSAPMRAACRAPTCFAWAPRGWLRRPRSSATSSSATMGRGCCTTIPCATA